MIVRRTMIGAALGLSLLGASALVASGARADDKGVVEQAREEARARMDEAREAERSARQKLREAEQKLKAAERELKGAAADAKQAAEQAVSDAKQALERAKLEATAAGTRTIQTIRSLRDAGKQKIEATLDTAHSEAHAATDKASGKAAELKADVAEVAAEARNEAEGAAQQAGAVMRHLGARTHEIVREAVGATGENALRRQARRMAWRNLSSHAEHPRDLPPSVREELRRHAQRIARLRRVRVLASEKNDPALVERADKLLARENGRHEKKLAALLAASRPKQGASEHARGEEDEQDPADEPAEEEEEQP